LNLWQLQQREYQLFAIDVLMKYDKRFDQNDIELLEYIVMHKSWRDTVDLIAVRIIGLFMKFSPEGKPLYVNKWLSLENIWLQRAALLFQLKYKAELDTAILSLCIDKLGSKESFLNKAKGWVLRAYSRTLIG
jgi:3-methyladenine DNA glycosylase AlkD